MTEPGWAVWITGLPASGKSSLSKALKGKLSDIGVQVQILESDVLRKVLTPKPTYGQEERDSFYNALVYIGWLLVKNGVNVIFDATANKREWRAAARRRIEKFIEVYIRCPLEVCMERDPKGIYRKAASGEAFNVPGVQKIYEEPVMAEIELDCLMDSPVVSADRVMEAMSRNGFF